VQEAVLGRSDLDDERIEVCARYRSAVDEMAVGGDWHDVIALPNGTLSGAPIHGVIETTWG